MYVDILKSALTNELGLRCLFMESYAYKTEGDMWDLLHNLFAVGDDPCMIKGDFNGAMWFIGLPWTYNY